MYRSVYARISNDHDWVTCPCGEEMDWVDADADGGDRWVCPDADCATVYFDVISEND